MTYTPGFTSHFTSRSRRSLRSLAVTALAAAFVAACGGGSSGSLDLATLQGRWESTGAASPQTAIIVPAASSAAGASVWLLNRDGSALSWLDARPSGSDGLLASGSTYPLSASNAGPQPLSWSGTVNLAANSLSVNGATLQLTRTDTLKSASSLGDVTGNWSATFTGAAVAVNLGVAANGSISGQASTGCAYSGQLSARSDIKVFDATLTESCNGSVQNFNGIGTYRVDASPGASALTLALRKQDGSAALVILLAR